MEYSDFPPHMQERITCSIAAATKYELPVNLVLALAEKEGGKPGLWVRNANGTHDVGFMQFNTGYLGDLKRYNITANDVSANGCYSFELAAWRLRKHIRNDKGDLWTKAANYHSRTYKFNQAYRADLMHKANKWADWLGDRYITYDVLKPKAAQPTPKIITNKITVTSRSIEYSASGIKAAYVPRKLIIDGQQGM